jgi:hypothetical protein
MRSTTAPTRKAEVIPTPRYGELEIVGAEVGSSESSVDGEYEIVVGE